MGLGLIQQASEGPVLTLEARDKPAVGIRAAHLLGEDLTRRRLSAAEIW
jgi:hypothetical protein